MLRRIVIVKAKLPRQNLMLVMVLVMLLRKEVGDVEEEGDCEGQAPRAELDVGDGAGDVVEEGGW